MGTDWLKGVKVIPIIFVKKEHNTIKLPNWHIKYILKIMQKVCPSHLYCGLLQLNFPMSVSDNLSMLRFKLFHYDKKGLRRSHGAAKNC